MAGVNLRVMVLVLGGWEAGAGGGKGGLRVHEGDSQFQLHCQIQDQASVAQCVGQIVGNPS